MVGILVECDDYRDPAITQGMTEVRADAEDAERIAALHCARYLTGYDPAERDAYLERENEAAPAGTLAGAPQLRGREAGAPDHREEGLRILVGGTPGHSQVLYEYLPDASTQLDVVAGFLDLGLGPGRARRLARRTGSSRTSIG